MALRLDNFRGQILWCTTERHCFLLDDLGKAEICYLNMTVAVNQQILRFQITVGNVHLMQVIEGKYDLTCKEQCHIVRKATFASQQRKQLTTTGVVQHHVNMGWRLERAFQAHNERVLNRREDFLLRFNMVDLLKLNDSRFLKTFEGNGIHLVSFITMLNKAHAAESTGS